MFQPLSADLLPVRGLFFVEGFYEARGKLLQIVRAINKSIACLVRMP